MLCHMEGGRLARKHSCADPTAETQSTLGVCDEANKQTPSLRNVIQSWKGAIPGESSTVCFEIANSGATV